MNDFILLLLLCYLGGFLLTAFVRRWWLLALASALLVAALLWAWHDTASSNTPGGVIGMTFVYAVALGVATGMIASAIVMLARMSFSKPRHAIILLALFVAVPTAAFGLLSTVMAQGKALRAPAEPECHQRLHTVFLAQTPLALPLVVGLRIGQGVEFQPQFDFRSSEDQRKVCASSASGPMKITNMLIQIPPDPRDRTAASRSHFCASAKSYVWWHEACGKATTTGLPQYPISMRFYSIGEYNARRMLGVSHELSDDLLQRNLKWESLSDGLRRTRDEAHFYFARDDKPGYVAQCHGSPEAPETLFCIASYRLTARIGMAYDFRATTTNFAEQSALMDRRAREVFESLKSKKH